MLCGGCIISNTGNLTLPSCCSSPRCCYNLFVQLLFMSHESEFHMSIVDKRLACVHFDCHSRLSPQIPADLMLRIERCWATPTSDPYSNIQYTFIRDRSASQVFVQKQKKYHNQIYSGEVIFFLLFVILDLKNKNNSVWSLFIQAVLKSAYGLLLFHHPRTHSSKSSHTRGFWNLK